MAVIERLADTSAKSGPEKLNVLEDEIREYIRHEVAPLSPARPANDSAAKNLNELIQRVSDASMQEIDRVISELQGVRELLRNEGERVNSEIAGYASLSHASMTAMKVIGDSIKQWKGEADKPRSHSVA